jgi:hypothetical protein
MTLEDNIPMDFQKCDREMDWINLAQDRDKRRAIVNEVMKLQFP